MWRFRFFAVTCAAAWAADVPEFERLARPVLERNCAKCHTGAAPQGGLDVMSRAGLVKGGKSGAAVIPKESGKSLLIAKIEKGMMPPGGRLSKDEIAALRSWIDAGAPARDADGRHWAFVPPVKAAVPKVRAAARVRTPVDAFVLAALEKKGLALNPEADRATLARRLTYDLIGLPPTPEDVRAFVEDKAPDAYDKLVEKLLASSHYGERWGRHWLDAAGYADSEGVLAADVIRPNAWRYRDYVIKAFNKDKPFDRFLREQIAGDEISEYRKHDSLPPDVVEQLEATGFLRTAVDATREDFLPPDFAEYTWRTYFDTQQIFTSSLLGLSMHCARCHDHKYEPLTQKDYYGLAAFFAGGIRPTGKVIPSQKRIIFEATKQQQAHAEAVNKPLDDILKALRDLRTARVKQFRALHAKGDKATEAELREGSAGFAAAVDKIDREIEAEQARRVDLPTIRAMYDFDATPPPMPLFLRGDPTKPGDPVEPRVPEFLGLPAHVAKPAPDAWTSGRRTALANWLTDPKNPLVARVMVNRVWAGHFGTGIVAALDNFGKSGPTPSHPELLDWLAVEFVERGWSIKELHRVIVKSAAYRQSSAARADGARLDPDNMLLWRMPPRRMEAELVRDAILAVSGSLDPKMFGAPVNTETKPTGEVSPASEDCKGRRTIYQIVRRSAPQSLLNAFDAPVMEINCTRRVTSASAAQALAMMNSDLAASSAGHFANRLLKESPEGDAQAVRRAFELAFARQPAARELDEMLTFLKSQGKHYPYLDGVALRWQVYADLGQALMASNEFVYID